MYPEIRDKLIEVLKAGEYQHGTGTMKAVVPGKGMCYCIHGVICDLYSKETQLGSWKRFFSSGLMYYFNTDMATDTYSMPAEVRAWAGIDYDEANHLMSLNDKSETWELILEQLEHLKTLDNGKSN